MVRRLSRALEVAALIAASALTPGCIFGPGDDEPPVVMPPLAVEGAASPKMAVALGTWATATESWFTPLREGADTAVQHGPQGGHHLEFDVRIEDPNAVTRTEYSTTPFATFNVETSVTSGTGLISRAVEAQEMFQRPDGAFGGTVRGYVAADTSGDVTVSVRIERYDGSGWQLASQRVVAR